MQKWFLLMSFTLASTDAAPEPIRRVLADQPWTFGTLAVAFAVAGGLAVQHHAWIHGKVTLAQASSEIVFSAIAGLVGFWILAKAQRDELDLCVGCVLLGMAGRPLVVGVQNLVSGGALRAVATAVAGVAGETPNGTASQNSTCMDPKRDRDRNGDGDRGESPASSGEARPGERKGGDHDAAR